MSESFTLPLCPMFEHRLCPSACHRVSPDQHCWHQDNDNERIADLERTFDLRWKADIRAIARWRAAAPGRNLTMPDHADLCVWLLERDDERKRQYEEKFAQAKQEKFQSSGDAEAEGYFQGRIDLLQWILEVHHYE
jgi:hypothetical protein